MKTLPGSRPIAGVSRRSFFGRAAATSGAVLLGSTTPAELFAQNERLPGRCDFPEPIPHINVPPPGGAHFYFPGPVSGAAAPTDPSGAHAEGRDRSGVCSLRGFVGQGDLELSGTGIDLAPGPSAPYTFRAGMRFLEGVFVGTDRAAGRAAFAFV